MKVLECRVSGEEMCSDAFDLKPVFGGYVYKVPVTWKVYKIGEDFALAGANPSAEEEAEAADSELTERKLDYLKTFDNLKPCAYIEQRSELKKYFSNKERLTSWKKFLQASIDEEDICDKKSDEEKKTELATLGKDWLGEIQKFRDFLIEEFKKGNLEIYCASVDNSEDDDGAKIFYVGDDSGDHMYVVKHWFREEKC